MTRLARWLVLLLVVAVAAGTTGWLLRREVVRTLDPDPVSIASASLQSIRESATLVPFAARYVAVVTSTQRRFGLSAQKTLILPGSVRYEIDLAALRPQDLRWDAATATLSVTLPPVTVAGPEVELGQMREYGTTGLLTTLTDASSRLDASNRAAATIELLRQARAPVPMRLAREAARRAVERSFAMPLNAAGLRAQVQARFADEGTPNRERWDRSRSVGEVLGTR